MGFGWVHLAATTRHLCIRPNRSPEPDSHRQNVANESLPYDASFFNAAQLSFAVLTSLSLSRR